MCELCTTNPADLRDAQANALDHAINLDTLADAYRRMASGEMGPHSLEATRLRETALEVVRELVTEWL